MVCWVPFRPVVASAGLPKDDLPLHTVVACNGLPKDAVVCAFSRLLPTPVYQKDEVVWLEALAKGARADAFQGPWIKVHQMTHGT